MRTACTSRYLKRRIVVCVSDDFDGAVAHLEVDLGDLRNHLRVGVRNFFSKEWF